MRCSIIVHFALASLILVSSPAHSVAQSLKEISELEIGLFYEIGAVQFLPEGDKFVVLYSTPPEVHDGVLPCFIEVRTVTDGAVLAKLEVTEILPHTSFTPSAIAVSKDGGQIAIGDTRLVLWEWENDSVDVVEIAGEQIRGSGIRVVYNEDESKIALFRTYGVLFVDLQTFETESVVTEGMLKQGGDYSVRLYDGFVSPDFTLVGTFMYRYHNLRRSISEVSRVFAAEDGSTVMNHSRFGYGPQFSSNKRFIYSITPVEPYGGDNANVYLVKTDMEDLTALHRIELIGKEAKPYSYNLHLTKDDRFLLYRNDGPELLLIDVQDGSCYPIAHERKEQITGKLALSPDNSLLISSTWGKLHFSNFDPAVSSIELAPETKCSVLVAPNPTTDILSFVPKGLMNGQLHITIIDDLGQMVVSLQTDWFDSNSWIDISADRLAMLASGTYRLVVTDSSGSSCGSPIVLLP